MYWLTKREDVIETFQGTSDHEPCNDEDPIEVGLCTGSGLRWDNFGSGGDIAGFLDYSRIDDFESKADIVMIDSKLNLSDN